jgi:hypothetical protein
LLLKQKLPKPLDFKRSILISKRPGRNARPFRILGVQLMGNRTTSPLRLHRLLAVFCVIAAGLTLRRFGYDLGLSFFTVKYGGSVLWGAMVFLIVGGITGARRSAAIVAAALLIAIAVEFSRLYQAPWIDAFRLTLAGKLLLGRIFSLWNILAYAIGIGLAAITESVFPGVDGDQ